MSFDWSKRQLNIGQHLHTEDQIVTESSADEAIVVYRKTRVLTNDEVKALPTTAVEIVPAPGEGKALFAFGAIWTSMITEPYTNINTTWSTLFVMAGAVTAVVGQVFDDSAGGFDGLTLLLTSSPGTAWTGPVSGPSEVLQSNGPFAAATSFENLNLRARVNNNDSGDFTGGDEANSLTVTILYTIIDL